MKIVQSLSMDKIAKVENTEPDARNVEDLEMKAVLKPFVSFC